MGSEPKPPLTPEILVPKLGDYLVEKGIISPSDLQKALLYQQEFRQEGKFPLLGEVLLEMRLIDRTALDEAITEQIIQLRSALQNANRNLEKRVKERTAELQEALRKLSELNQLKSNFIANISHELRTPLTHIKGYVELLLTQAMGSFNPQQTNALQVIQRSTERLERQIDDLIRFSMAARGEVTLKPVSVDLHSLFNLLAARSKAKAEERKVVLTAQIQDHLPPVNADEEKLTWALLQLLDNAIKFTPEHGQVSIEAVREQGFVRISVADTGIGIPPERIREIFEPFHQLDGSATRRFGGTGLGLALVRQIIDAHGSVIKVSSEVGQGTCFEFLLALA
ncbi:MAG: HAMP domain-containing histidine kinase [Chloroflexi bacterium]|nr:HAMP domain-containing histidine kinase [Chloroflexota bacterium]